MKNLNIVIAALGGIAVGATLGLLFAPEKGTDTRAKIQKYLASKGIKLSKCQLDEVVDEIQAAIDDEE